VIAWEGDVENCGFLVFSFEMGRFQCDMDDENPEVRRQEIEVWNEATGDTSDASDASDNSDTSDRSDESDGAG
jgi:hypothetical protein